KNPAADAVAAGEMTPSSLRNEIKEKVAASLKDKVEVPADGKKLDKSNDEVRKAEQAEYARRLAAGEPLPWDELVVDIKRVGQPMKWEGQDVKGDSRVITPKILGGEKVMMEKY